MVTLRCFGGVAAVGEDGVEHQLRSRKHLGLLLYLVAHPRTVHSREELAGLLWDGNGRKERHSLSQALYDIRSNVAPLVAVDSNTVRLRPERIRYEAAEFERAVREKDHETALDLYRGEFAPNLLNLGVESFDRWLDAERESHRVLAALALRNAQRAAEERGDWDEMCLAALRLIRDNEFDDEAHCALMRGLWLKGDPASALAHYESVKARLEEDTLPLAGALEQRLRSSETASVAEPAQRHGAPLYGRDRDFALLRRLLLHGGPGLRIVLAGEPGVGKTALLDKFACFAQANDRHVVRIHPDISIQPAENSATTSSPGRRLLVADHNCSAATIDRLLDLYSNRSDLLIVTSDLWTGRDLASNPRIDSVIALSRLDVVALTRLLLDRGLLHDRKLAREAATQAGGNPILGIALAAAWQGASFHGGLSTVWSIKGHAIRLALSTSVGLQRAANVMLNELGPSERRVANLLAALSSPAQSVAACLSQSPEWGPGYRRLRARNWLIEEGEGTTLAIPLLSAAIRAKADTTHVVKDRSRVAEFLAEGNLSQRYASAAEYSALGERAVAHRLAKRTARDALQTANRVLASRAADVAYRPATSVQDRLESGFLLAETEISRGSPTHADAILSSLRPLAADGATRVRLHCGLSNVAMAQDDRHRARQEALELKDLAFQGPADPSSGRARLQAAVLDLWLKQRLGESPVGAAADLLDALQQTRPFASAVGDAWLDAVKKLVWVHAGVTSRDSAASVLAGFAGELANLSSRGAVTLELLNGALELRGARLHAASRALENLIDQAGVTEDRLCSATLNNLAVVLMERGDFSAAEGWLRLGMRLDAELGAGPADRLCPLINRALCRFFVSEWEQALVLANEAIGMARTASLDETAAQALAISGLCHLQRGRKHKARAVAEALSGLRLSAPFYDDQYLVTWFEAAMAVHVWGQRPRRELVMAAESLEPFDVLGAMKLRVLAQAAGGDRVRDADRPEHARRLRAAGASWFERHPAVRTLEPSKQAGLPV